ncbi:MAG: helix-turn-helix domain-containing protein [Heteroscytonema crispum UTEX LB 1556]
MSRRLKLTIHETKEELEKRLKAPMSANAQERLQMLYWLKNGQVNSRKELVKRLNRGEATISRWLKKYQDGGLAALLEVKRPPGKKTIIPNEAIACLEQRLKQPQGFKSYREAQQWLQTECGVVAAYKTVHKLVRYKLRAKLKVPRPCSHKQHPSAQEIFKKTFQML